MTTITKLKSTIKNKINTSYKIDERNVIKLHFRVTDDNDKLDKVYMYIYVVTFII